MDILASQVVMNLPANACFTYGIQVWSLDQEHILKDSPTTHPSMLG